MQTTYIQDKVERKKAGDINNGDLSPPIGVSLDPKRIEVGKKIALRVQHSWEAQSFESEELKGGKSQNK
jgi:hypothetical protein